MSNGEIERTATMGTGTYRPRAKVAYASIARRWSPHWPLPLIVLSALAGTWHARAPPLPSNAFPPGVVVRVGPRTIMATDLDAAMRDVTMDLQPQPGDRVRDE